MRKVWGSQENQILTARLYMIKHVTGVTRGEQYISNEREIRIELM